MKLRVLKPYLLAKSNGGEISLLEYLRRFSEWGWDVKVSIALPESSRSWRKDFLKGFGIELQNQSYRIDSVLCEIEDSSQFHPTELWAQKPMEDFFQSRLEKEQPDLVWAHYTDFFALTAALKWDAEKTWVFQTDNEYPRLRRLENFPSLYSEYQKIKHFLVASTYMKKSCEKSFPQAESFVLPRIVIPKNKKPMERKPEYWLFINPVKVKGVDFMIQLSKACPDQKFLFVGNWGEGKPSDLPKNVSYLERQNDLTEVFSSAKALLMPSVWQEAFGRVALEAMAHCVPVVSSRQGALPETLGKGGLSLDLKLEDWVEVLHRDENFWQESIKNGAARIQEYRSYCQERLQSYRKYVES